ncbi:(d)CMP kinase [Methanosalsum natronophilum]|uniref:Cytidylate kinase n=1 Tax=Methanosalsum natronophilum TaxID=768733 RepID=A0A424YT96_9EURY|nr:AAA family ATPase [Methanosalsum natronophilum]MCS3924766.1 cytidylate kinase [Methanosalsum natronophilum]RQD82154.1 MAG: cytidylate kinase [Methanosalsum natronophilum]
MLITVSGLPGSGTSSISSILSKHYGMQLISAGSVFRSLAKEHNMTLEEFGHNAEKDSSIDLMIDERQREIAEKEENVILEGRLAGHMAKSGFSIWLKAPFDIRVERIAGREHSTYDTVYAETKKRELSESLRYKEIYGIDLEDHSIYDIVLDSKNWNPDNLSKILIVAIDNYNCE